MGDYVTAVSQIESEFKDTSFGASTLVTSTEVDEIIDEMESYVNSIVGAKYAVPVTSTAAVPFLRRIVKWLVVDVVVDILNSRGVEVGETQSAAISKNCQKANLWLQQLCDGKVDLVNADPTIEETGDTDVFSYQVENALEPKWEKDTDQW